MLTRPFGKPINSVAYREYSVVRFLYPVPDITLILLSFDFNTNETYQMHKFQLSK